MINAKIQCDIVLKSFVPKVVPQSWMDPIGILFHPSFQREYANAMFYYENKYGLILNIIWSIPDPTQRTNLAT